MRSRTTLFLLSLYLSGNDAWQPSWMSRSTECSRRQALVGIGACLAAAGTPSSAQAEPIATIPPCPPSNKHCISTSSVRQVDLYMPPWTYPPSMSAQEVVARLKGACQADIHLAVQEEGTNYLRLQATRNFASDTLEFVVDDGIIRFTSLQTEGPDLNDFGAQRKRLDEIRQRSRVFSSMGAEFETADNAPREGALGQLKAFYGIRSGKGFEDIILEDE